MSARSDIIVALTIGLAAGLLAGPLVGAFCAGGWMLGVWVWQASSRGPR